MILILLVVFYSRSAPTSPTHQYPDSTVVSPAIHLEVEASQSAPGSPRNQGLHRVPSDILGRGFEKGRLQVLLFNRCRIRKPGRTFGGE